MAEQHDYALTLIKNLRACLRAMPLPRVGRPDNTLAAAHRRCLDALEESVKLHATTAPAPASAAADG